MYFAPLLQQAGTVGVGWKVGMQEDSALQKGYKVLSMADVHTTALSILGIWITGPGLMLALNAVLPGRTERAYRRLSRAPWKSFFIGLGITIVVTVFALVMANIGAGIASGVSVLLVLFGLALWAVGAAGMTRLAADWMETKTGSGSRLRNLVFSALALALSGFVPLIGWFLFTPLVGIIQIGAGASSLFGRDRNRNTDAAGKEKGSPESSSTSVHSEFVPAADQNSS